MLNALIRFALRHRLLTMAVALLVVVGGIWSVMEMPIDVFPDLDRPRVVVMTEAPGLAPEEVESLITIPLEMALNGAQGVQAVRSSSGPGISIVNVEFDFGSGVFVDRQIVNERLAAISDRLPPGIRPQLAPVSSIMGQIMVLAVWSSGGQTDPLELRTQADWVIAQRLRTIRGVAQIYSMGGGRRQFQIRVDPASLSHYGVTLRQVRDSLQRSNENATGGYLDQQGPSEILVRAIGRIQSLDDLRKVVVTIRDGRPVALGQVATITEAAQSKRGDSSAFVRIPTSVPEFPSDGTPNSNHSTFDYDGGPAVVLTITRQPEADTRRITAEIRQMIRELQPALSDDIRINVMYSQDSFIDRAVHNVMEALRDGGLLVVIILFLFLMNLRTTFISLTAIPLSLAMTVIVFQITGMSINTMTLGGLAVAIGELVDDAIVDVENIFRRLRENRGLASPLPTLVVVYRASTEIRNSIVFSTLIVCLVFIPLFALQGIEGRLFTPLAIAYVVSILSSLLVSLTVTPVLSWWLLGRVSSGHEERDSLLLRGLKHIVRPVIEFSLAWPRLNLTVVLLAVVVAAIGLLRLDRDFLPDFNEGAVQLNVLLPPGTSLSASNEINQNVEKRLQTVPDVMSIVRRTGRAELDEHAEPVSASEYILELDPGSRRTRVQQIGDIRDVLAEIPGIMTSVEQPISHLMSHMLSGVRAQIGIKLFGDNSEILRRTALQVRNAVNEVPGVRDLIVEPQTFVPQLRIELNRDRLLQYGLTVADINEFIQTAMRGQSISEILEGQRTIDLVLLLSEDVRGNPAMLRRLAIETPEGGQVPLEDLAHIFEAAGPHVINREKIRRRLVVQCNVAERGVVDVAEDIQNRLEDIRKGMPPGYHIEFSGQFESQRSASRVLLFLFLVSLVGVFLVLHAMFRSVNLSLQVMAALPMAFIGAVAALVLTGQTLTVAAMVGFISLSGIASRNGILLLNHYLHLVRHEGESWTRRMIVRAGLERLAPVLMTALTAGIGLIPLVLAADQPGKEVLYPVATVILGGVISSTLLDFFVHPALFWLFGLRSAARVVSADEHTMEMSAAEPAGDGA